MIPTRRALRVGPQEQGVDQMSKIICVGNAVVDIIVKNGPDRTPDGMTQFSEAINMYVGGDAVNEAVALHAMGNDVHLYTEIGNDTLGRAFLSMIDAYGLPTDGILRDPEHSTTATVVTVGAGGEHGCMTLRNGAAGNMRYNAEAFGIDFTGAKIVSVASLFWSRGQTDSDLTDLLRRAKEAGAETVADMVLDQSQMTLKDIAGALPYLDYLVPSYHEASYFTGKDTPEEIAAEFHRLGVKTVVLKLGADGVFASSAGKTYRVGTIAEKVVDTLGGGDNFVAGFITGIADGLGVEKALYFGSAAAAIAISQYGASGAVKSKQQVQDYLDAHLK